MNTPQLGSSKFTAYLTIGAALAALGELFLSCGTWALFRAAGAGAISYAAAILVPAALSAFAAWLTVRPFNRRFAALQSALGQVAKGGLSVRLPQEESGMFSKCYSDFNRMAQELQNVRSRQDEYINTFTHEFKTPLTAIRGFAELLQQPGFNEDEKKKYLQIIFNESCALVSMTNDTLLLAKLENKNLPVTRERFWLDEQVSHALTLIEASIQEKHQSLSTDIEPVEIVGSKELLIHVWLNLISNAVKYTQEGGAIRVSLKLDGGQAVFTVSDNGIGMTEQVKQQIFARYYQADPARPQKGIGLGLSIVHNILELCSGRIDVESAPGQGSTFRVFLPLGQVNKAA